MTDGLTYDGHYCILKSHNEHVNTGELIMLSFCMANKNLLYMHNLYYLNRAWPYLFGIETTYATFPFSEVFR